MMHVNALELYVILIDVFSMPSICPMVIVVGIDYPDWNIYDHQVLDNVDRNQDEHESDVVYRFRV